MAGFQAQDLTVHFDYKDNKIGKNCDSVACKYKDGRTHYHCRYCSFVRAGLSYDKMIKHMRSKHSSNLVSQVSTEEQQTLTELNIESDPSDPALEKSPQLSPPRSFIIKKSKVSTPMSAEPGSLQIEAPFSPLFHKTKSIDQDPCRPVEGPFLPNGNLNITPFDSDATTEERESLEIIKRCVIPGCNNINNLKQLIRMKTRGHGNLIDLEQTLLLLTYYRLDKVGRIFEKRICHLHWREWYDFNHKLKETYNFDSLRSPRKSLFEDPLSLSFQQFSLHDNTGESSKMTGIFGNENIVMTIFNHLNIFDLKQFSLVCKTAYNHVCCYLANESVWERLLLEQFFVDRTLNEKTFSSSFKEIFTYCSEMKNLTTANDVDFETTIDDLVTLISNARQNNTSLDKLLKVFGYTRKPHTIEILVYFVAKCLRTVFLKYHTALKANHVERLPMFDFRVGVESNCIPFALMLFDIVLTGNEGIHPTLVENRHHLLKLLAINSIRQKMNDYKVMTPYHMAVSNDISLTCSKTLMTVLNKSGISISYHKDQKDSKNARHIWNTIGIKSALENCQSNLHWIECDNLETMLKSTTIHNAERLTHFVTSQLEYVPGKWSVLDLYQKPPVHMINDSCFHMTESDTIIWRNFLDLCLKKCVEICDNFNCDNVVSALAQDSTHDNRDLLPSEIDMANIPSERLLDNEEVLSKPKTVYLRMEKLCSSNIFDIKKLLDLTADDYQLNEIKYIPSVATSPLLFASTFLNENLIEANYNFECEMPSPYTLPWGFLEATDVSAVKGCYDQGKLKSVILNSIEKLKDQPHAIYSVAKLLELTLQTTDGTLDMLKNDKVFLSIFYAELLRKQGFVSRACELLLKAHNDLSDTPNFKTTFLHEELGKSFSESLLINAAVCSMQIGSFGKCLQILNMTDIGSGSCLISKYQFACSESLKGCAQASLGQYDQALERVCNAVSCLSDALPQNHSVLGSLYSQTGVLLAITGRFLEAANLFEKAKDIFLKTWGVKSFPFLHTRFNMEVVKCMYLSDISDANQKELSDTINCLRVLYPVGHPILEKALNFDTFILKMKEALDKNNTLEICHFVWDVCYVPLLDRPFSWIDYVPAAHSLVFGADYQVWAHLDSLLHKHQFRYSWVSTIFLGSFHKLGNLHDKLVKRYGKFHLEKHAVAFLDDPTAIKVQYLLSMKDFVAANQFYYHDILAGLTELFSAFICYANEIEDEYLSGCTALSDIKIDTVMKFCDKFSEFHPSLNLISNYLFYEGMAVLGLLEAQKFGDFNLDMVFTKLIIPLQFTTRGVNYGPALTYHIRDMEQLRNSEKMAIKTLWVSNKSDKPGHCRPQDQNLEALFNNSAKNCFKLGTVQNVLNKASMIQEREKCHQNLKQEILPDVNTKANEHKIRPDSFIRLRAAWQKCLQELFAELKSNKAENTTNSSIHALHSQDKLNDELVAVRQLGKTRLDKFVAVKITQENGWCLQNPRFSEILTVPRAITARQQKAAINQANIQIETMTNLLLQSTGMQVTLSDSCVPVQLLKKDGKSFHFAKKSDLSLWLYKKYDSAFLNQHQFDTTTESLASVTCLIKDCMFEFRSLDIPTCTYKEMASTIIDKTVIPIARRYANRDRHFTLIQTFDRRADQTKGCTEVTRASAPLSPLEYSGIQVDEHEQIKAFKTRWLDRDNGRRKIITSYVRSCQNLAFLNGKNLPKNFTHVIIGGNAGIFVAYSVDSIGNVSLLTHDYACFHAEADTVVFFALKRFLLTTSHVTGSSIVIACPEADNVTILLLKHQLLKGLLEQYSIHLYCTVHNKVVDVTTGKTTKKPKESANIEEFRALSSKVKMDFYLDVGKLYHLLSNSEHLNETLNPIESLGALSIYTGNDKSPGIRHVTKSLALTVYHEACKEGELATLVDENGLLTDSECCKRSFRLLFAKIYFHIYRVYIRKLRNVTWDSLIQDGDPNFRLLRDIGCQYAKGQLDKTPPVDSALDEIFLRSVFQANEYDQIFEESITYLDPLSHGFEEYKGGLRPVLNRNIDEGGNGQVVIRQVDSAVCEGIENDSQENAADISCDCLDAGIDEACVPDDGNIPLSESVLEALNCSYDLNLTQQNLFDVTTGNVEGNDDEDSEEQSGLFDFTTWLDSKR